MVSFDRKIVKLMKSKTALYVQLDNLEMIELFENSFDKETANIDELDHTSFEAAKSAAVFDLKSADALNQNVLACITPDCQVIFYNADTSKLLTSVRLASQLGMQKLRFLTLDQNTGRFLLTCESVLGEQTLRLVKI